MGSFLCVTNVTRTIALIKAAKQGIENNWIYPAKGLPLFSKAIFCHHTKVPTTILVPGHVLQTQLISMENRN